MKEQIVVIRNCNPDIGRKVIEIGSDTYVENKGMDSFQFTDSIDRGCY